MCLFSVQIALNNQSMSPGHNKRGLHLTRIVMKFALKALVLWSLLQSFIGVTLVAVQKTTWIKLLGKHEDSLFWVVLGIYPLSCLALLVGVVTSIYGLFLRRRKQEVGVLLLSIACIGCSWYFALNIIFRPLH